MRRSQEKMQASLKDVCAMTDKQLLRTMMLLTNSKISALFILYLKLEEHIKSEFIQHIFGHPIIGDTLYGSASSLISRQALHSYKVSFIHPITKEILKITANLPEDMKKTIKK